MVDGDEAVQITWIFCCRISAITSSDPSQDEEGENKCLPLKVIALPLKKKKKCLARKKEHTRSKFLKNDVYLQVNK